MIDPWAACSVCHIGRHGSTCQHLDIPNHGGKELRTWSNWIARRYRRTFPVSGSGQYQHSRLRNRRLSRHKPPQKNWLDVSTTQNWKHWTIYRRITRWCLVRILWSGEWDAEWITWLNNAVVKVGAFGLSFLVSAKERTFTGRHRHGDPSRTQIRNASGLFAYLVEMYSLIKIFNR